MSTATRSQCQRRRHAMPDRPDTLLAGNEDAIPTVADRYLSLLGEACSEVIVVRPYVRPVEAGVQRLREARERRVDWRIVSGASCSTEVALVSANWYWLANKG